MRPFLLPILAITVTVISTAASAKERWEGYRTLDSKDVQDLNLPFEEFAKNAIFEMDVVGVTRTPGEKFKIVDVDTIPQETNPDVLSNPKNVVPFQIETCRKQNLKYCPVLDYSMRGTAFFNRGRFVTCRHGFHNWISLAAQYNNIVSVREISPPIILRNSKGEVVYNSGLDERPQMKFSVINDDVRLKYQTHGQDYPSKEIAVPEYLSDYAEMTLSEELVDSNVKSLSEHISNSNSLPSDETFLLGYALKTNNFPKGAGDSPGKGTLVISNGRVEKTSASFYKATNYSSPGISGGPLVTAKGELLGASCKSIAKPNPADVSSFSFPIGKTFAETYWRGLDYPTEQELASVQTPELIPVVSQ